jgi:hypothetical protein
MLDLTDADAVVSIDDDDARPVVNHAVSPNG